jgi:hypothetical protein
VGFVVVTALMVKYREAHCSNPKSPDSSTKTKRLPTAVSPDGRPNDLLLLVGYPDAPAPLRALGSTGLDGGARLFDLSGSRGLPYDLREGLALNKSSVVYVGGAVGGQLTLFWTTP